MERFDVSPIKINHLAFKLSNSVDLLINIPLTSFAVFSSGKTMNDKNHYPRRDLFQQTSLNLTRFMPGCTL